MHPLFFTLQINSMKTLNTILLQQVEKLKESIEVKQDIFNSRSDQWQQSDKGEKYENVVQQMIEVLDSLVIASQDCHDFMFNNS